jgi:hypothetical protein
MKKILILALALALSACSTLTPVAPTAAPTQTAVIQVATVLVEITSTAAPTSVPTATPVPPSPTPQVVVVTATGGAPTSAATSSGAATATATLPASAGGDLFTNMTRSGSFLDLRCLPQDITFSASTSNLAVTEVDFYYRIEDLTTQPLTISAWKNYGKMTGDKSGNYTIDVNTSQLSPDLRAPAKAWFDYQLVGFNKNADRVGGSGKISQQVLYLKDCP